MYASHRGALMALSTGSSAIAGQDVCGGAVDQSVTSLIVLLAGWANR